MTETYKVVAKRWKRGWELHIDGVGVTQVKKLTDAEAMVRDYIALDLDVAPDAFNVEIAPDVGPDLGGRIARAKKATADAERAQEAAASENRQVVDCLKREGLTGREIAQVLQVSPQRVSQLWREHGLLGLGRSAVIGKAAGKQTSEGGRRRARA